MLQPNNLKHSPANGPIIRGLITSSFTLSIPNPTNLDLSAPPSALPWVIGSLSSNNPQEWNDNCLIMNNGSKVNIWLSNHLKGSKVKLTLELYVGNTWASSAKNPEIGTINVDFADQDNGISSPKKSVGTIPVPSYNNYPLYFQSDKPFDADAVLITLSSKDLIEWIFYKVTVDVFIPY